ncbi:hypothetical protein JXA80_12175 [bacterium]|nr:hypothetical protein [candidate division CSSED10-310 bacterium]
MECDFLVYNNLLNEIENNPSAYFLYGGRGVGKTIFLKALNISLSKKHGKGYTSYIDQSCCLCKRKSDLKPEDLFKGKAILIDDFPKLFTCVIGSWLKKAVDENPNRLIVVTSRLSPGELVLHNYLREQFELSDKDILELSDITDACFNSRLLFPGSYGWKDTLANYLFKKLDMTSRSYRALFMEEITSMAGAHPSLLSPILEIIARRVSETENPMTSPDWNEEINRMRIQKMLADVRYDAAEKKIKSGLQTLKKIKPDVMDTLIKLARGHEVQDAVRIAPLKDTGLIYDNETTHTYKVSGRLIASWILALSDETETTLKQQAQPQSSEEVTVHPHSRKIVYVSGKTRYEVILNPGNWQMFQIIYENQGSPISFDGLKEKANKSELATRSAIQRLLVFLEKSNLSNLIVNVYGEGYRINPQYTTSKSLD